jgi:hypothetical protein
MFACELFSLSPPVGGLGFTGVGEGAGFLTCGGVGFSLTGAGDGFAAGGDGDGIGFLTGGAGAFAGGDGFGSHACFGSRLDGPSMVPAITPI